MKTFNKKGDKGDTSLLFGRRVPKCDQRCEVYGAVDEAVSFLGLARNMATKNRAKEIILDVQKDLFTLSAEIAIYPGEYDKFVLNYKPVTEEMVNKLETAISEIESEITMPRSFIIPGATLASAAIDVARAVIRRAEREAVRLKESRELQNELILQYLNRLADLLFTLARYEES